MPLAHFTNIPTAVQNMEILYKNLFEVTVVLPPIIAGFHPGYASLLLTNTTIAKFPTYPVLEYAEQRFKYSTREFIKMPTTTSIDVDLSLNMNQNDNGQVFAWRILKDWYDLAWNNEDGSLHYKKHMVGDIIVHNHDREGHIVRRVVYNNCQMHKIAGWEELDWAGGGDMIGPLQVSFKADYWSDFYY
jgi:hypothetical protein